MAMLSEDDLNLGELTDDELARAWDLWFDLAQATNEWDPPYAHGVFMGTGGVEESDLNGVNSLADLANMVNGAIVGVGRY